MGAVNVTNIRVGDVVEASNAGRRFRFRVDQIGHSGRLYGPQVAIATGQVVRRSFGVVGKDAFHASVRVVAPGLQTVEAAYAENAAREAR